LNDHRYLEIENLMVGVILVFKILVETEGIVLTFQFQAEVLVKKVSGIREYWNTLLPV